MVVSDPRPLEMSEQDAIDSERGDREELWWFIRMIERGDDPRSITTAMVWGYDYGI